MFNHDRNSPILGMLILCFLTQSILPPGGFAAVSGPAPPENPSLSVPNLTIRVPARLGRLEEIFEGETLFPVLLIQDAHAHPDAQRNLAKLIRHFQIRNEVRTIALEGASGPLDFEFLRSFPDQPLLRKLLREQMKAGELAGGPAAGLFHPDLSHYEGIEDWKVYEESIRLYQKALESSEPFLKTLNENEQQLKARRAAVFSPELLEISESLDKVFDPNMNFSELLHKLSEIKAPSSGSSLDLFLKMQQEESPAIRREILNRAQQLLKVPSTISDKAKKDLAKKLQSFRTSQTTAGEFGAFLHGLCGDACLFSGELSQVAAKYEQFQNLNGSRWMKEFETYAEEVKSALFKNDAERNLERQIRQVRLLKRLAMLQLSRGDWRELSGPKSRSEFCGSGLQTACAFYDNAESRDRIFIKNLARLSAGNEIGKVPVILIAGGFHTEGLAHLLRERKISYRVISPRMDNLRGHEFYLSQMNGKVSWQSYLKPEHQKIDLYTAYHRAMRDHLLQASSKESQPQMLRAWHDQIIRNLASKQRLEKTGQYTRFLDEVVRVEKKQQFENGKKIKVRIEEFIRQLKILKTSGALTPESMVSLIQNAKTQTLYAVAPFQPRARFNLMPGPGARSEVRSDDNKNKKPKKKVEKPPVTQSLWTWTDGGGLAFKGTKVIRNEKIETVVEREFQAVLKSLDRQILLFLATRYGLNLKNILWGMIGSSLAGKFDKEQIEKAIDAQIVGLINQMAESDTDSSLAPVASSPEIEKKPVAFEPTDLSQNDIVEIAKNINNRLQEIEAQGVIDRGLYDLARDQAAVFITKLEERFFFKNYYNAHPDAFTGTHAADKIKAILQAETQPLVLTALGKVLEQIENAIALQAKLHEKGMSKTTYLNLYQLVGVQEMLESKKIILADEMGLGKTLETLAAFLLSDTKELMIFAPNLALKRWLEDIADHLTPEFDITILSQDAPIPRKLSERKDFSPVTFKKSKDRYEYFFSESAPPAEGRKRIVLMNYEAVPHLKNYQKKNNKTKPFFEFLAFDEAHLLKNRKSKTSGFLWGNKEDPSGLHASFEAVLTGTPLENGPGDLLRPLQYLATNDMSEAGRLFASIDPARYAQIFRKSDVGRLSLLHTYMVMRMIRRLKADVMTGLPKKKWIKAKLDPLAGKMKIGGRVIDLNGDYRRQLDIYELALSDPEAFERLHVHKVPVEEDELEGEESADEEDTAPVPYAKTIQITRLEQVALDAGVFGAEGDSIKLDAAEFLIRERLAQNKSIIIYSPYRTAGTERLRDQLIRNGLGQHIAYIDGSVPKGVRNQEINRFQNKEARIIIATAATAGVAINLTQADTVLWLNRTWKPSTDNQAIDRAHRYDPERNFAGKELEIIDLELDLPVSIDALKADFLRRKEILAEIIVNGNLTAEILKAYRDSDETLMEAIEEAADNPVKLDEYELTVAQKFRLLIGRILQTKDAEELAKLWEEAASLYVALLDHKGSFYANMASLDHLASEAYPELKGSAPKQVLDLASGPSTLYQAYKRRVTAFVQAGFLLDITDYDASEQMLKLGIRRPGHQILGSFSGLKEMPANQYNVVNLSYAFRYAEHPADAIQQVHRMLKNKGIFVLILPSTNIIPPKFYEGLKRAGFTLRVGENAQLQSKLDPATYQDFVREFGKEFADDMARHVKGVTTYLVASKDGSLPADGELTDEDFRLARELPVVDKDKILKLKDPASRYKFIPEDAFIVGEVKLGDDSIAAGRKEKENQSKLFRRSERTLLKLAKALRRFQETPWTKDPKSIRIQSKLAADIDVDFENLQTAVETYSLQYDPADRESLRRQLETFKDQKFVRTWLTKSGRQSDIDEMIQTLQRSEVRSTEAEKIRQRLRQLYERQDVFDEEQDVTPLFSPQELIEGLAPMDFPLPGGQVWGDSRSRDLNLGKNLDQVEFKVNRSQDGQLNFTFSRLPVEERVSRLMEYFNNLAQGEKDLSRERSALRSFTVKTTAKGIVYLGRIGMGQYINVARLEHYGNQKIKIDFVPADKASPEAGIVLWLTAEDGKEWYRAVQFGQNKISFKEQAGPGVKQLLEYIQAGIGGETNFGPYSQRLKSFKKRTDSSGSLYLGRVNGKNVTLGLAAYPDQEITIEFFPIDPKQPSLGSDLKLTTQSGSVLYKSIKFKGVHSFEERAEPGVQELLTYITALSNGETARIPLLSRQLQKFTKRTDRGGALTFGHIGGEAASINLGAYGDQDIAIEFIPVSSEDTSSGVAMKLTAGDGRVWYRSIKGDGAYFENRAAPNVQEVFEYVSAVSQGTADLSRVSRNLRNFKAKTGKTGNLNFGTLGGKIVRIALVDRIEQEIEITHEPINLADLSKGVRFKLAAKDGTVWVYDVQKEPGYFKRNNQLTRKISTEKQLREIYVRQADFEETIEVTPLFSVEDLTQGFVPVDFPLPGDQVWGTERSRDLKLGKNLKKVEIHFSKKAGQFNFTFTGTRRSEVRSVDAALEALQDYIQAVAQDEQDLSRVSAKLTSFKKRTSGTGMLFFGKVENKNALTNLKNYGNREILIEFEPVDSTDASKGVYVKLTDTADGHVWYRSIKKKTGYFEDRAEPWVQKLLDYVQALRGRQDDLARLRDGLQSFRKSMGISSKMHLGYLDGKMVVINLTGYSGQTVLVEFEPEDPETLSQGVYVKLTALDGHIFYRSIQPKPPYFEERAAPGLKEMQDYFQAIIMGEQDLSLAAAKLKRFNIKTGKKGSVHFGEIQGKALKTIVRGYANKKILVEFMREDEQDASQGVYVRMTVSDGPVFYRSFNRELYSLEDRAEPGVYELLKYIQAAAGGAPDLSLAGSKLKSFKIKAVGNDLLIFGTLDGEQVRASLAGHENQDVLCEFEPLDPPDRSKGMFMKLTTANGRVSYRSINRTPKYIEERAEPGVQELMDYVKAYVAGQKDLTPVILPLRSFAKKVDPKGKLYFGFIASKPVILALSGYAGQTVNLEFTRQDEHGVSKGVYLTLTAPDGQVWIYDFKKDPQYFRLDRIRTLQARLKIKLRKLYARTDEFLETVDVTDLFGSEELSQGIVPVDYPLPDGQVWGLQRDRDLRIGKDLIKVEMHISRKAGGLNFTFTGIRRSELRFAPRDSVLITLALLRYPVLRPVLFEAAKRLVPQIQFGADSAADDFERDLLRLAALHGNSELMTRAIQTVAVESRAQLAEFAKRYGQSSELLRIGLDYPPRDQTENPVSDRIIEFYAGFLSAAGWSGQPGHYQIALIEKNRLPVSQRAIFQKAAISLTSARLKDLKKAAFFKVPLLYLQTGRAQSNYSWLANLELDLQEGRSSRQAQELTIDFQLATAVGYSGARDTQEARGRFEKLFELVPLLRQYADYGRLVQTFGTDAPVNFVFDAMQTETALQALALDWAARSEVRAAA